MLWKKHTALLDNIVHNEHPNIKLVDRATYLPQLVLLLLMNMLINLSPSYDEGCVQVDTCISNSIKDNRENELGEKLLERINCLMFT